MLQSATGRVAEDEAAPVVGDADVRADDGYRRVDGRRAPDDGPTPGAVRVRDSMDCAGHITINDDVLVNDGLRKHGRAGFAP